MVLTLRFRTICSIFIQDCVSVSQNFLENFQLRDEILKPIREFWGQNAKEFYPERWLEDKSLEKAWFYQPFGGGPRNCIGMRLALMEIKLGVLKIIQRFDPV